MNTFLWALPMGALLVSSIVCAQEAGNLFPELRRATGSVQKVRDGKDAGLIRLVVNDVQIINPPLGGVSLCQGTLTAENNTNVTLEALSLSLTYGALPVPVQFGGVPAYGNQTKSMAFAGENCKNLLNVPQIKVENCVAGPMSLAECESKLKYVPIEGAR